MHCKKKDAAEFGDYRNISVVVHARKVLLKLVATCLSNYHYTASSMASPQRSKAASVQLTRPTPQCFWPGDFTSWLARKKSTPLYVCVIDLIKACDSVDRELLWTVLERFGVSPKILAIICKFLDGMRACVRTGVQTCFGWLDVGQGLGQGCNLAQLLFFFAAMLMVSVGEFPQDDKVMADMVKMERDSREKERSQQRRP